MTPDDTAILKAHAKRSLHESTFTWLKRAQRRLTKLGLLQRERSGRDDIRYSITGAGRSVLVVAEECDKPGVGRKGGRCE